MDLINGRLFSKSQKGCFKGTYVLPVDFKIKPLRRSSPVLRILTGKQHRKKNANVRKNYEYQIFYQS